MRKPLIAVVVGLLIGAPLYASALSVSTVPQGGTGIGALKSGYIPYGAGTSPFATSTGLFYNLAGLRLVLINASTTALSANVFCLTADTCRTTWPTAGSSASTTLLVDNNTFSGVDKFTNALSDFSGTWQTFSPSHFQVEGSYLTSAITGLTQTYGSTQTGATQTFATSSDTNIGLTITNPSSNNFTFTPTWTGTLADNRIASASTWNGKQNAIAATWPQILTGSTLTFGGLGTTTNLTTGQVPYVTGVNTFGQVATGSITCTGTASCGAGSYVLGNALTITGSGGGGGSGTVSTSTNEIAGRLAYWTSNSATPALLGQAATGTISGTGGITATANQYIIGSGLTIGCTSAGSGATGCLSSTDWNTFNNKLGSYDAWTHPSYGGSATTSLLTLTTGGLLVNAASSTINGNLLINGNSTTTNATSTNFFATTASTTNLFGQLINGFGLLTCTGTNALTWSGGSFGCAAQPQGTVTSVGGTWPITSSGGATPTITWSGLASTSNIAAPQVLYATGVNTFAGAATGTVSAGVGISLDNSTRALLGGALQISNSGVISGSCAWPQSCSGTNPLSITWAGLASTSNIAAPQVLYATGVNTFASVATGTVSAGSSAITVTASRYVLGGALAIDCATASAGQNGCLSSANWSTFNSKLSSYDAWTHSAAGKSATTSIMGIGTTTPNSWPLTVYGNSSPQFMLSAGAGLAHWFFANEGGNLYIGTTTVAGTATSTLFSAISINGTGAPSLSIGSTTASFSAVNGLLTLGSNGVSGSSTVSMGKVQIDGYSNTGSRICIFVVGTTLTVAGNACTP